MCRRYGLFLSALLCALLLAFSPAISYSQSPGTTAPVPSEKLTPEQQQLIQGLFELQLTILLLSTQLGEDFSSWPQQIADLKALSAQRKDDLKKATQSLADSEAARQAASNDLDKSKTAQDAESQSFSDYKKASASAQASLQQELAQERASKVISDYVAWGSTGAAGGAIIGSMAGKSLNDTLIGAGIGAASGIGCKLLKDAGHALHLW